MDKKTMTPGALSSLCMELYLILQAGISLSDGVDMLRQGDDDLVLTQVAQGLFDGQSLQSALAQTGAFPTYLVDMVAVGEQTGNLDRCLKALATHYTQEEQRSQTIRKAVVYPAVLLTMLTVVLLVLIVEVLPMFSDVYSQLGGTLSGLGAWILAFGMALGQHWVVATIVAVLVVMFTVFLAKHSQKDGQRVLLSKKLGWSVATTKVASVLAMAVQSGLDMDSALDMAITLTQHPQLRSQLDTCKSQMLEGVPFAQAMEQASIFPRLHCRMLDVGMRTGALDTVLADIAQRCDSATQDALERHIANVEPTLVMVMSMLVGVVLLSVMLPLASIMTALG